MYASESHLSLSFCVFILGRRSGHPGPFFRALMSSKRFGHRQDKAAGGSAQSFGAVSAIPQMMGWEDRNNLYLKHG